jgi:3-phosphoshikimate 1-carboxyvinyltransferase
LNGLARGIVLVFLKVLDFSSALFLYFLLAFILHLRSNCVFVFACCVAHKVNAVFTGIKNLKFKESDRVSAMIDNLLPLGLRVLEQTEDTIRIDSSGIKTLETYYFKSYSDHRIAMACSLFVLKGNIVIDNERVVNKSFPDYWQWLQH